MRQIDLPRSKSTPLTGISRLTHARLRRPTRLPMHFATTRLGRYLDRLRWLFGST